MLQPLEQCGHTEETFVSSQGRALNRKSLLVSAPTGQMSAMFPASSFSIILPSTVPMKVCSPRFSTAISSKPATSLQRFTHRMQRMQRFLFSTSFPPTSSSGHVSFSNWNLLREGPRSMV